MKRGPNRTIEDRLQDIETELLELKSMLTVFFSTQTKTVEEKEQEFMNVKDVARFLKIEATVVYAACNKGEIPFLKVGKMYSLRRRMF